MKIEWKLDEEGGIDPIDPVGDISISDGERTIQEEATYLDSWFDALIAVGKAMKLGNNLAVEIAEEPYSLKLKLVSSGAEISYKNKTILVNKVDEFIEIIRQSATCFVLKLNNREEGEICYKCINVDQLQSQN
ncbi:hypothetical protein [Coleofasciculus sp. G2-EDA-02]|uniref:hypothetical protein n=1 Tax=Coleofasciculus sp. G2-EDA-02 TaxID=3069529 RepID=UPI0032FD3A78